MFTSYLDLFKAIHAEDVIDAGHVRVKEIINCSIELRPSEMYASFVRRGLDYGYIAAQLAWYLRAQAHVLDGIDTYDTSWRRIVEPDVNSNYGLYVFAEKQWVQCVLGRLRLDPLSRQAIILFNRPEVHQSATTDHICTTSLQFLIRDDNLYAIGTMRSNDIWGGMCHDVPFFMMLQALTVAYLRPTMPNLQQGLYFHHVGSMHAYERDWKKIADLVADPTIEKTSMPELTDLADARRIVTELGPAEEVLRMEVLDSMRGGAPTIDDIVSSYNSTGTPVFCWHIRQIVNKLCQIYSSPSGTTPPPLRIVEKPSSATKPSG